MSINRQTLDLMMDEWAVYYSEESRHIGWARTSISGKMMDAGINGTKPMDTGLDAPYNVQIICDALPELAHNEQLVIKQEYSGIGRQREKAKRIKIPYGTYKCKLITARKLLMSII